MLGCEVSDPERRRRNELRAGKVAREDEAIGTHEPEVDRIGPAARCEVVTVAKGRKGWGFGCVVRWCGAGQGRHKKAPLLTPETNGGPYRLADGAIIGRGFMACWRADKRIWRHIEITKRA